jgi:hypothetical protein
MFHLLPPPALPGSGSKGIISGVSPPLLFNNLIPFLCIVNGKQSNDEMFHFMFAQRYGFLATNKYKVNDILVYSTF